MVYLLLSKPFLPLSLIFSSSNPFQDYTHWTIIFHLLIKNDIRSSRPKVISPEVMSPKIFSQVARKFVSCHKIFKNKILLIWRAGFVSSRLKERGILHTHFIRISGDLTKNFGRDDFRVTWPVTNKISGQFRQIQKVKWAMSCDLLCF